MYAQAKDTSRRGWIRTRAGWFDGFDAPPQPVPIHVYKKGRRRKVGVVVGDVFRKVIRASRHTLYSPEESFAVSESALAQAKALGARTIEVVDSESCRRWTATIAKVEREGFTYASPKLKPDIQIALPVRLWREVGGEE